MEAAHPEEKFLMAEGWLKRNFMQKLTADSLVEFGINVVLRSPFEITIREIIDKSGYSPRHFIHQFKKYVGVPPKSFLRVIRFQKTIAEIGRLQTVDWGSLANRCGYYDQSHFIADFRTFSGFTPSQYFARKTGSLNYIPVA